MQKGTGSRAIATRILCKAVNLIFMKRKPLNKSRLNYLKQNTPLNVVPEKKLKRADLAGFIENRGKSHFRTKRLRERVDTLISIDLVFKNKTNAKPHPQQLVRTTFVPQARNTLKAKYPFHLNMNAKRTLHVSAAIPKQQPPCYGSWCQATVPTRVFSKSCLTKTFGCTLKSNTCIYQILEKNKSIKTPSLINLCKATPWLVEGVADKSQHKRGYSSFSAKQLLPYVPSNKRKAQVVCRCQATHPSHSNARYIVVPAFSKAHSNRYYKLGLQSNKQIHKSSKADEQKKTTFAQKGFIGTKYIVKKTALGSTRVFSNTRFKVHSQDLKQLIEGRGRKVSPYKARLLERKKLSLIYGNLGWREIRKCVLQSKHKKGVASPKSGNKKTRPQTTSFPENLITLLESRVDVVLYRCRFFPSFSSCKQAINHGKIFVNHRQVRIAGHLLKAGDVIQVNPQSKQSLLVQKEFIACFQSFKQEIARAEGAIFSEREESLPTTFANKFANQVCSSGAAIGIKTLLPCPDSARKEQEHVVSKKANYLLALENEKQKTLLYFQNKIKSRPFSPSLPSTLLTRFDPLHHFPWNAKQKPNQLNNTPLGTKVYNKPDYGSCFLRFSLAVPAILQSFKRTKTPFSLNLENQAKCLFRDLKERKRILRTLSSMSNERLDGDGTHVRYKGFNTDRLIKPLRNRDNPSLFLRSQSKSGVESLAFSNNQLLAGTGTNLVCKFSTEKREEHNTLSLARAATGLRGLARKSEGVTGLKRLFPPFYRAAKPLNLEVSYQTLTAIFLFPPQKVYFPAHIDLEMIGKSI